METTQRQPVITTVTIDADLYDLDEQDHRIASDGFDEPEEAEAYFRMRRARQRADTEYLMSRVRRRLVKLREAETARN